MKFSRLLLLAILFLAVSYTNAQSPRETLATQAQKYADAIFNRDYESAVKLLYPLFVQAAGGHQKVLEALKGGMEKSDAQGVTLNKISMGTPSVIVKEGLEDVAIIPTEMEMSAGGKKGKAFSYMVAVSQNNGKSWYFFEGPALTKEELAKLYPKLVATVKVPEKRNELVDELNAEINEGFRQIEQKEGKPIEQILDEQSAEFKRVVRKIEENGLRLYIEKREGKKLEEIPTRRLIEILKELKIE
ncbi:MAG TPA: hypothetical protein VEX60_11380 [Pyrinomonadaceae bacterium]|nr:hypothetical protein [Pyrinomonadaceae bacterium]